MAAAEVPARLSASEINDDQLDALYERAEQAEARVKLWQAFIERGFTEHMRFDVMRPDGTVEQLSCADWCYACRIEQAEAAVARVRALADPKVAAAWPGFAVRALRAALDGPSAARTGIPVGDESPAGLTEAPGTTGGLG